MLIIKNLVFLSLWTLFLSLISYSTGIAAPNTQNELTWDRIEVMGAFTNIPEIKYDANVEARDNIGEHRYELTRLEGDLGYQFLHNLSIWGGYNLLAIQQ